MKNDSDPDRINPMAMPISDSARILTKVGGRVVSEEMLRTDIDAGAPTNADGTLNLVHYAAWNVKQMAGKIDGD